jgi:hypothetical protein
MDASDIFNVIAVSITVAVVACVYVFFKEQQAQILLQNWAARSGYRIIHYERRRFFMGPFFWLHYKGQVIFRVKVRDSNGKERWGWVRCGGWMVGILFDQAAVIWDDNSDS